MRPVHGLYRGFFAALLTVGSWLAVAGPALAADRVLIIGATSRSAAELIPQALERGYQVTALARRPEAVRFEHSRLTVVKGDVYDVDSLVAAMRGDEVVITMVGPRVDPMKEVEFMDLYTVGTANIMQARQWGVQYARDGIRVVSVSPGAVDTPLVRASLAAQGGSAQIANRHPLGRIGEPHEIARTVVWLASEDASFITATDLEVDGGLGAFGAFADPYPTNE